MKKLHLLIFISLFSINSFCDTEKTYSPALAGSLGIFPGIGHLYQDQPLEGFGWFSSVILSFALSAKVSHEHQLPIAMVGQNLLFYSMYDAYRDAGGGPSYDRNLLQNYIAFFNPVYILDPFAFAAVAAQGYWILTKNTREKENDDTQDDSYTKEIKESIPKQPFERMLMFSWVGLGEEALFRGFMFPAFTTGTKSLFDLSDTQAKWAGATLSSSVFTLAHGYNLAGQIMIFLFGMIYCWQVDSNDYDLRASIFTHGWWDTLAAYNLLEGVVMPDESFEGTDIFGVKFEGTF